LSTLFCFGFFFLLKIDMSVVLGVLRSSAPGCLVQYCCAHVREVEARFGRRGEQEEAESETRRVLRCDLLILDDLGSEMSTSFSVSVIYEILNTRLRERRSTVVSSNLDPAELARRYNPQIASRLTGSFEYLRFYGRDIRIQKKEGKRL